MRRERDDDCLPCLAGRLVLVSLEIGVWLAAGMVLLVLGLTWWVLTAPMRVVRWWAGSDESAR